MGKPTVAFYLPEYYFTARGAAIYARPNEGLDFARQIALLMDDPGRRSRMGEEGRERIGNNLAWHHQSEALLKAYKTLLSQMEEE
jgi:glycosyltransferase involved in cell wall biosynthesis